MPRGSRGLAEALDDGRWQRLRPSSNAKAGTIMAPVYVVVKARSTTYCALFLAPAQDMDNPAQRRRLLLIALFFTCCNSSATLPAREQELGDIVGPVGKRARQGHLILFQSFFSLNQKRLRRLEIGLAIVGSE